MLKELPIVPASEVGTKGPGKRTLTSDVVLGTVQHVGSMDELVACATHPQLCLGVAQNDLPPAEEEECTRLRGRNHQAQHELTCSKHAASPLGLALTLTWHHTPRG